MSSALEALNAYHRADCDSRFYSTCGASQRCSCGLDYHLLNLRAWAHGEGQEHAIADVNAGRVDDMIQSRLNAVRKDRA